ncbi:MAG: fructose-specific PTS transporter subunit EIIC [Lactobacillales bacterium]|jgi:PTS system fructose-specific IIC component|nr:fructose-specific PTS transporter subunit EIIC [Lactobacillales bacterium]
MEITELLNKKAMILDLQATTKEAAIDEMVAKLYEVGAITDVAFFKKGILAREAQTSTGLGEGIAMPHAKNEAVKEATVLYARSSKGVDYEALDGQPVYNFFMIAAPAGANDTHLQALAKLSQFLMKDGFQEKLKVAKTPEEVQDLFKEDKNQEKLEQMTNFNDKYIVAVTACTTGIAHTYMAEEALKKQAKAMGVGIKVETNGASGVGNRLTAEDIAKADGVIIAADKAVEMDRFDGKHLVNRPVADGIRKPEELIDLATSDKAPIYTGSGAGGTVIETGNESLGKKFYKHLMSGVSSMLPFVIGGGIAIALAFLIDQTMGVPNSALSQLGTYHPAAAFFKQIGGAAFGFMLPVLSGYIAYSIAEKPGLVAGFVAGAIASNGYNITNVGLDSEKMPIPSGFLGALVGGFLAGGVILLLKKIFANLPKSLEGIKSILLFPVLGVIVTGFAMLFVNIPMSAINTGLNGFLESLSGANAFIMGAVLGGMMAIDMGGPFNKAAYVFGTGTLAATISTGGSPVMAAVMAGGMVPPLAIFVATVLFKNKFSKEDRNAGLTNIIMGLSFITEGAIPFAAADPARAIPSFIIGSALSGGLVGAAGIKLLAPHGGIFVIALTNNPLLYLVFVLVGAVVAGILFGLLKKPVNEVK